MASFTANTAKHYTTAASPTIDDTTLSSYGAAIEVVHRGTTDPIYFRLGRTAATTPAPALLGDNNFVVMPGRSVIVPWPAESAGATVCVETICASAQGCSIQVLATRQI
jgi:hypothetical protein